MGLWDKGGADFVGGPRFEQLVASGGRRTGLRDSGVERGVIRVGTRAPLRSGRRGTNSSETRCKARFVGIKNLSLNGKGQSPKETHVC